MKIDWNSASLNLWVGWSIGVLVGLWSFYCVWTKK